MTRRADIRADRWGWVLVLLAVLPGLLPQVAEGRSSAQLQVSATVLPRCQEWRAGGVRADSARTCAPGLATLVRQADDVSVRCAPGTCPQVIRQADPADGTDFLSVMF